jgi:tetratricopeptide (TPR) repeat protein
MKIMMSIVAMMMAAASTNLQAADYCGDLRNAFGPFDYTKRNELTEQLRLVESAHFTPEVEKLIKGNSGYLAGDLDYTLRAFPNHVRALASLARLSLRDKTTRPPGAKWSVECYFNRAIRFKPDDGAVRMTYGSYLFKLGRTGDALEQLEEAARLEPESGTINYNLALIYFDKKDYDKALIFAKKAEALEFPLPGLKNKLSQMGKWDTTPGK